MANAASEFDCLIFGGGLAGSILAWTLIENGKRPLVVDSFGKSKCSQVAAGLINPIGGKRLNLVWDAEKQIPYAQNFYRQLGAKFHDRYYTERKIARLFSNEREQILWEEKKGDYGKWSSNLSELDLPSYLDSSDSSGFAIKQAGIVRISELILKIHQELKERGALQSSDFKYEDIKLYQNLVNWKDYKAPYAVFAEGHLATENPWFNFIPYKPSKGVIGLIKTSAQQSDTIIIQGKFIIPTVDGSAIVGATYDWESRSEKPDSKGIAELEAFLGKHLHDRWEWIETRAGVRPTIPGAMPAVGPHPEFPNLFSFNGFGSKGATQTPILARALYEHIWQAKPLPKEITPARFSRGADSSTNRWIAVELARDRVSQSIELGDTVIDATTGNGHDTLWLAQAVGSTGTVYAFDLQRSAIARARDRLVSKKIINKTSFLNTCHSEMVNRLPSNTNAKAIVFNLGYLPEGDKSIVTKPNTTISALNQSLSILKPKGIISIVIYPGHPGGNSESAGISNWAQKIDKTIFKTEFVSNPSGNPKSPYLLFVERVN